ncbi:NAD-dependent epimerase/dehydratase family protein [Candidatus Omnitrophota bacterium]
MDIRGKRFLLTGGAGLIGSHTVDELLKENVREVIIYDNFCRGSIDNLTDALKDPRCKICGKDSDILRADALNAAMKGIDGVFHFAALWLLHCYEYPRSAFDANIKGTFNVLEACVNNNVARLVFSSSASVYGDAAQEPMTEGHPYNNTNFYGATKIAGEHMCRAFYHRYALPYAGLRYMNVYGPRQDYRGAYAAVIMKMLDRIDCGLPPVIHGDGSQSYDFVYAPDCAAANVCAMKADPADSFYNVGTGIKTSVRHLAELLIELTGSTASIRHEPAGRIFVKNRIGSTLKAKNELGFAAKRPLREGLRDLIAWRKTHKETSGKCAP